MRQLDFPALLLVQVISTWAWEGDLLHRQILVGGIQASRLVKTHMRALCVLFIYFVYEFIGSYLPALHSAQHKHLLQFTRLLICILDFRKGECMTNH
jgi:hypothetical protein